MKDSLSFFNTRLCTGCLLCEMACSLKQKGECSRDGSFIKVSIHPYLGTPMVALAMGCNCLDGHERCVEICNQKALKFVPRAEAVGVLPDRDWIPCPLF
jgi:Fe-S-cluster-containing hydrogenase component 2